MSSVPPIQILPTGVVIPQVVDIRAGVLADTNVAFGGDLDIVTPSTPQAHLADNLTSSIFTSYGAVSYTLAMMDPATSEGRWQDGIARIYFINRNGATASVVEATCTGQPGVVMPVNSLAQDDAGNLWSSLGDATFDVGGQALVQFACQVKGPVELGIGQLTRIALLSPGWDALVNLPPAIVGSLEENRTEFESRRRETVANNANGSVSAIRASIWLIDGVIDVFVVDNPTSATVMYGVTNYPLLPHSVYVGVVGGLDQDIANAIWTKKATGCDMNGNTTVTVTDDSYDYPKPSYAIKFNRPASLPIKFAVQIANSPGLPANIVALTQAAIQTAFNGGGTAPRPRMGGLIFASAYFAQVSLIGSSVNAISIKIGTVTATLDQVSVGIDQEPTLQDSDITVTLV